MTATLPQPFTGRLATARAWLMSDREDDVAFGAVANKVLPALLAAAAFGLIGASIRVWTGVEVIQRDIAALVKSDQTQDQQIESLRTELNDVRVRLAVLRSLQDLKGGGKP